MARSRVSGPRKIANGAVADGAKVDVVAVSVRRWDVEFMHSVDSLCKRTGKPVVEVAVQFHEQAPAGTVLAYMDPQKFGRLVLCHHRTDYERVHEELKKLDGCRLKSLEPIPGRNLN